MKNILVPCDFSKPAVNAYRFALEMARKSKGTVFLIHVIELPSIHDPIIMPVMSFEKDFLNELKDKTTERFQKLLTRYKPGTVSVITEVTFGATIRMIQDSIKKKKIDIVIMGSHGATGLREYFIGSNAEKMVRNSTVPVLIIKDFYRGPVRDIVFPNTLELESQQKLIEGVKELQAFFKARLHILYVNTPTNFTADNITLERLRRFAKEFSFKNYTLNVYNYPFEEAGIIHFTKSIKGDLIAMGTHGRKGLAHFLNGSLAEDVANHANCPIWTLTNA